MGLWALAFVGLLVFISIYSIVNLLTMPPEQLAQPVPSTTRKHASIGLWRIFLSLVLAWVAGVVRRPLFPVAIFRVGGGRKRDDSARFWRLFVGGTVVVPVLLALVLAWIGPR